MKKIIIADEQWMSDEIRKTMKQSNSIVVETELPIEELADRIQAMEKGDIQCRDLMEFGELSLSKTEYQMLMYLMEYKDSVVTKEELLKDVWGFIGDVRTRVTDDTLKRIRKKILEAGCMLRIDTIRGIGYILRDIES